MTNREIALQNAIERLKYQASMAAVPARYQNVPNFQNSVEYQNFQNAAGYTVAIDTLTAIRKSIVHQKFYQLNGKVIGDYMPVAVGDNAFADDILTYKDFIISDDFEAGIQTGSESELNRITQSNVQIQSVLVPTRYWTNELNYSLIDLGKAARAGNWSLIEAKERGRKKVWDLGLQKVAFLGMETDSSIKGLLTQSDVNSNTTVITKFIKDMSTSEFQTFLSSVVNAAYANSNSTVMPNRFVIPQTDFNGLGIAVDETFNFKTRLQRMYEAFRDVTGDDGFQILPLVYAQKDKNASVLGSGSGLNRYTMMRYDSDSVLMEIPLDYTTTIQDTIQGFAYQGVAYGQFSSVKAFRPLEMLYFDHSV